MTSSSAAAGSPATPSTRWPPSIPTLPTTALIDSEVEAENVKCISYREQEGAYLIGALAALTTDGESHKYGAVHVNEGPGSWKWRYGYMEGVKSIDPDAEFVFNYTGSYSDPAKAKELAIQQYEQGCVFINSAAAGGDGGTFEAAKEKGFYTSGQDVDLTDAEIPTSFPLRSRIPISLSGT
ncbi:MAG: BMP family ABC transporter substrate-binding protein [Oscillospiraceae bacterium]